MRSLPHNCEEESDDFYTGHAPNYIRVYARGSGLHNEVRMVKITELYKDGVLGEIVE